MNTWTDVSEVTTPSLPLTQKIIDLQRRVQLLEAVIDNFPGGLLLFDHANKLVLCNDQQRKLLGYPDELFANGRLTLKEIFEFNAQRGEYGAGDIEHIVQARMDLVEKRMPHNYERMRPNGTILEIRGVPLPEGGFVTSYLDVTEQRKNQKLIAHLAHHDQLTGLPNRLLFEDRLKLALAGISRGHAIALLYIDLNKFKPINDTFGHEVGDIVLKKVASVMQGTVRATDTVARVGGDEFVIIQTDFDTPKTGKSLASKLSRAISQIKFVEDLEIQITTSIGVACSPWDGEVASELMRKADMAMYRGKKLGGNQVNFYSIGWEDDDTKAPQSGCLSLLLESGGPWDAAS